VSGAYGQSGGARQGGLRLGWAWGYSAGMKNMSSKAEEARADRLGKALRANLRRRKAQARAMEPADPPPAEPEDQ